MTRLTANEWDVLMDAANAFEAEPANFEGDADDKRLEALRNAIRKLQSRPPIKVAQAEAAGIK